MTSKLSRTLEVSGQVLTGASLTLLFGVWGATTASAQSAKTAGPGDNWCLCPPKPSGKTDSSHAKPKPGAGDAVKKKGHAEVRPATPKKSTKPRQSAPRAPARSSSSESSDKPEKSKKSSSSRKPEKRDERDKDEDRRDGDRRDKDRDREKDRDKDREKERDRDREKDRREDRDRQDERERDREQGRDRDKDRDRDRDREDGEDRDRDRDREDSEVERPSKWREALREAARGPQRGVTMPASTKMSRPEPEPEPQPSDPHGIGEVAAACAGAIYPELGGAGWESDECHDARAAHPEAGPAALHEFLDTVDEAPIIGPAYDALDALAYAAQGDFHAAGENLADALRGLAQRRAGGQRAVSGSHSAIEAIPQSEEQAEDAAIVGIVREAREGKGNFGLGAGTRELSEKSGLAWVGEGYTVSSDGKTLVSKDKLRAYRPPSWKPRLGKTQSNFEERLVPEGRWQSNGHLDIVE